MDVLVVDDEPLARQRLRRQLETLGDYRVVGEAGRGDEALRLADRLQPDVVLLDIRMPGMDGLETARHLAQLELSPAVIFTTAYGEYALAAFDRAAVAYLLKPIRAGQLGEALARCRQLNRAQLRALGSDEMADHAPARRSHLCIRKSGNLVLIPIDRVLFFQADQKYVRVVHDRGEELIEKSLAALHDEFGDRFIRIHRSTLVNRAQIRALVQQHGQLRLELAGNDERLDVSRRHAPALRALLRSSG